MPLSHAQSASKNTIVIPFWHRKYLDILILSLPKPRIEFDNAGHGFAFSIEFDH